MSYDARDASGVWRFREFLPDVYGPNGIVTLNEGNVPLNPRPAHGSVGWPAEFALQTSGVQSDRFF